MVSSTILYPLLLLLLSCSCMSDVQTEQQTEPTGNTGHFIVDHLQHNGYVFEVAFSATLGFNGNLGLFEHPITVVYENVLVNGREGYNSKTGIFTAPFEGVYFFAVSGYHRTTHSMDLRIFKNEQQMVTLSNDPQGDRYESASISIILNLEAGDQVYVRLRENSWVFDNYNNHNSFVGHLICPFWLYK